MHDVNIGPSAAFSDPGRRIIAVAGVEVGVFKLDGEFRAYENICPHMGGPACQGKVIPKVEEVISSDRTSCGLAFSKSRVNVVCPWHGYEFDIRTGRHAGHSRYRLRPVKVRVENGDVIVTLPPDPSARIAKPESTVIDDNSRHAG
jgi:nitrite reductase/ring-hydroxylating ferredoxin subunit